MKAKLRRIVVDSRTYLWRVVPLSPNFVCLRIWMEGRKTTPWADVRCRFDNPWIHFGEIISSPKEVVENVFQLRPLMPAQVAHVIRGIASTAPAAAPDQVTKCLTLTETGALVSNGSGTMPAATT